MDELTELVTEELKRSEEDTLRAAMQRPLSDLNDLLPWARSLVSVRAAEVPGWKMSLKGLLETFKCGLESLKPWQDLRGPDLPWDARNAYKELAPNFANWNAALSSSLIHRYHQFAQSVMSESEKTLEDLENAKGAADNCLSTMKTICGRVGSEANADFFQRTADSHRKSARWWAAVFFVFGVMNIVQHQCIIDPPRLGLHASFGGFFLA